MFNIFCSRRVLNLVSFKHFYFLPVVETTQLVHSAVNSTYDTVNSTYDTRELTSDPDEETAIYIQNIIKFRRDKPTEEIEQALSRIGLVLNESLVLNVLCKHHSDWSPAYVFFNWVRKDDDGSGYSPGSNVYNEILDILGKSRRFHELNQVFDEMSKWKGLVNKATYGVLLNRYAAAHMVEKAINVFNTRKVFGLEMDDFAAFQMLLMWLCRYKHVEVAETLFYAKQNEFQMDIKTRNIILNGWCVLENVREVKRFWKDIIASRCKPDLFTYGIFINALTKKGKLGSSLKLFRAMCDKGYELDVTIFNCVINALCFKKRIPEALDIYREMKERDCPPPNVVTYNTLIKYLSKIRRMENVYDLVDEMEQKKGGCLPNVITYSFLLKSLKKPEDVPCLLDRMERNGCRVTSDMYNLILKLYMEWSCEEKVKHTWNEMERTGLGPDRRSYTIMIHGYFEKGRKENALRYFREMTSKGMLPENSTEILMSFMNKNISREGEQIESRAN